MAQLQTEWKRLVVAIVAHVGVSAMHLASAASPDEDKLALLSCAPSANASLGKRDAVNWLNQSGTPLPNDAGMHLSGPLEFGKACLKNVTVTGSFGVMLIQGEICSERLGDFTDALAAIGIPVGKVTPQQAPGAELGSMSDKRQYVIGRGMIDMRTGKTLPTTSEYAFLCSLAVSGPK
jgi:hypothetical protein